ncbi:recombination associated protein [compost metagenome]
MEEISIHEAGALLAAIGRIMIRQGVHCDVLVSDDRDDASDSDLLEIMGNSGVPQERARELLQVGLREDVLKESADYTQNDDEKFGSDMVLMTGELAKILAELVESLGGEKRL